MVPKTGSNTFRTSVFSNVATGAMQASNVTPDLAAQGFPTTGGNINYVTGYAIFEATHGTAPKYAGQDKVNPGSVILSGVMMFEYMGWLEAADLIYKGLEAAIASKRVTYDFHRQMEVSMAEFQDGIEEALSALDEAAAPPSP